MSKKFELGNRFSEDPLHPMYEYRQIIALRKFDDVKKGEIGGFIESEFCLDHTGDCWIHNGSFVDKEVRISGNARIGYSDLKGDINIRGSSIVINTHITTTRHASLGMSNSRLENAKLTLTKDGSIIHGSLIKNSNVECSLIILRGNIVIEDVDILIPNKSFKLRGNFNLQGIQKGEVITFNERIVSFSNVGSENGTLTVYRTSHGDKVTRGCFSGTVEEFLEAVKYQHRDSFIEEQYENMIELAIKHIDLFDRHKGINV